MDYSKFTVAEFVKDEYFQQWVYSPTVDSDEFWNKFLKEHPVQSVNVTNAREFLYLLNYSEQDILEARIVDLKKRIDDAIDNPLYTPQPAAVLAPKGTRRFRSLRLWRFAVAACVLVVLAVVSLTVFFDQQILSTDEISVIFSFENKEETGRGERTYLSLADGSSVWLNSDSRLFYSDDFESSSDREVYLEGEAFFNVAKNEKKPFIVNTGGVRIKVLGTSFNVRSYKQDQSVETTLVEGKVVIESPDDNQTLTLVPNQRATFHKDSRRIVLANQQNVEYYTSWKEGKLFFENEPVQDVIAALERWYDVSIHFDQAEPVKCRFSAKMDNLSIDEVLELFKESEGISYRIEGKEIFIKGSFCHQE